MDAFETERYRPIGRPRGEEFIGEIFELRDGRTCRGSSRTVTAYPIGQVWNGEHRLLMRVTIVPVNERMKALPSDALQGADLDRLGEDGR